MIKHFQAFTLVEVLISLVLFSLIMSFGLIAFRGFLIKEEVQDLRSRLQALIEYARSEALIQGIATELCVSENAERHGLTHTVEWRGHLLVKTSERILKHGPDLASNLHIYWHSPNPEQGLHFDALGFTGIQQGSFYVCPAFPFNYLAESLVILRSGRLRVISDYSMLADFCERS